MKVNEIERKEYVITIRIPISGIDDYDARAQSKELISGINSLVLVGHPDPQIKLQEVYSDRKPRGIQL